MASGIIQKSKTTAKVAIPPNLPLHRGEFESTIAYFFSILSDCSNYALPNPYRY